MYRTTRLLMLAAALAAWSGCTNRYVIEGAAGVVVASFLKLRDRLAEKNVVLVICGGNIEVATFREAVL